MDSVANRREVYGDLHGGVDCYVRDSHLHRVEFRRERGGRRDDQSVCKGEK